MPVSDQTPSLGRIVRYTDVDGTEVPAAIADVHGDGSVDLHVLHPTHGRVPKQTDDGDVANTWHWPDYVAPRSRLAKSPSVLVRFLGTY